MNVITYALACYGVTAVISFFVIGIVLVINSVMSRADRQNSKGQ